LAAHPLEKTLTNHHQLVLRLVASLFAVMLAACEGEPGQSRFGDPAPQAASDAGGLPNFARLVKEHGPAVVNISAVQANGIEDPLAEFFRRFGGPEPEGAPSTGLGSGFIISEDGFVLTNAHLISEGAEVMVKLTNKREYKARVIGVDTLTDVALIKIDASDLPFVKLGHPDQIEPGEWVAAIGAPFGFENSVTVGVVSAKERVLPDESYVPFIQIDAAVNPGNSGGPLFSVRGEVIGINSAIYSQTGGFMGIAFAIPIDIAMNVAEQLRETGKVTRGRIGVQVQELTLDLATSFGLKDAEGALIAAVEADGPAAQAGIQPGDVVLAIDDKPVATSADLARIIASTKPGTTVSADLWRKTERLAVKLTVTELASKPPPG
jgi:serine protease Do